jgi:hypothetical protein
MRTKKLVLERVDFHTWRVSWKRPKKLNRYLLRNGPTEYNKYIQKNP